MLMQHIFKFICFKSVTNNGCVVADTYAYALQSCVLRQIQIHHYIFYHMTL